MAQLIQLRRGTAAAWTSADPTLSSGEVGFETDTGKLKFGDGATAWTSLAYTGPRIATEDEADGATIALDFEGLLAKTSIVAELAGNRAITFANPLKGGHYSIRLTQDSVGTRTVTWPSSGVTINWAGGSEPVLTTTVNKTDWIVLICVDDTVSAEIYDGAVGMANA